MELAAVLSIWKSTQDGAVIESFRRPGCRPRRLCIKPNRSPRTFPMWRVTVRHQCQLDSQNSPSVPLRISLPTNESGHCRVLINCRSWPMAKRDCGQLPDLSPGASHPYFIRTNGPIPIKGKSEGVLCGPGTLDSTRGPIWFFYRAWVLLMLGCGSSEATLGEGQANEREKRMSPHCNEKRRRVDA